MTPDALIVGNDTDIADREPHREEVNDLDRAQIYEPIVKITSTEITRGLIGAVGYQQEGRLMPSDFDEA